MEGLKYFVSYIYTKKKGQGTTPGNFIATTKVKIEDVIPVVESKIKEELEKQTPGIDKVVIMFYNQIK